MEKEYLRDAYKEILVEGSLDHITDQRNRKAGAFESLMKPSPSQPKCRS